MWEEYFFDIFKNSKRNPHFHRKPNPKKIVNEGPVERYVRCPAIST